MIASKHCTLEDTFWLYWVHVCRGPALSREHPFAPPRRWRFDFAHAQTRVAVEIEGAVWTQGRHTRGSGYTKDCEKYNHAAAAGWAVFRLTADMVHRDPKRWCELILDTICRRQNRVPV